MAFSVAVGGFAAPAASGQVSEIASERDGTSRHDDPQEQVQDRADALVDELSRALGIAPAEVEALGLLPAEMRSLLGGFTEETVIVGSRAQPRRTTESAVLVDVLSGADTDKGLTMSTKARVSIQPSSRLGRSDAIIFTEFDDTVVMMDAEEGSYYELDPVGTRIWVLAESEPRVAEVLEALAAEYEVAPDTCRDEVRAFMDELLRLKVIRVLRGGDARDLEASSITGRAAAAPRAGRAGAKLAWTTPTIRVMSIVARTKSGTYGVNIFDNETTSTYSLYSPS